MKLQKKSTSYAVLSDEVDEALAAILKDTDSVAPSTTNPGLPVRRCGGSISLNWHDAPAPPAPSASRVSNLGVPKGESAAEIELHRRSISTTSTRAHV